MQNTVWNAGTSRTGTSAWITVPVGWRRTSRRCGSTATPPDTVCRATPTALCREWTLAHAAKHAKNLGVALTPDVHPLAGARWWMSEAAHWTPGQGELPHPICSHFWMWLHFFFNKLLSFIFRPVTTIAAAIGGVVLFFILLALLVFYLRRQKKLRKKETLRRILQEHEVG